MYPESLPTDDVLYRTAHFINRPAKSFLVMVFK